MHPKWFVASGEGNSLQGSHISNMELNIFGSFSEDCDIHLLLNLDDIADLQEQCDVASHLVQYELQRAKVLKIEAYDPEYETIVFDVFSETTQQFHRCLVSGSNALKCALLKPGVYIKARGGLTKGDVVYFSLTYLQLLGPPPKGSSRKRGKKIK